jgi:hypothetical protein
MSYDHRWINNFQARRIAELLADEGFDPTLVTPAACEEYAGNVIRFCAGADPAAERKVRDVIQLVCGWTPYEPTAQEQFSAQIQKDKDAYMRELASDWKRHRAKAK